jgi:hypothetical protein
MLGAQLLRSGRPPKRVNVLLGDIALNQDGIQAAWETSEQAGSDAHAADAAEEAARATVTPAAAPEDTAGRPPDAPHRDEQRPRW